MAMFWFGLSGDLFTFPKRTAKEKEEKELALCGVLKTNTGSVDTSQPEQMNDSEMSHQIFESQFLGK